MHQQLTPDHHNRHSFGARLGNNIDQILDFSYRDNCGVQKKKKTSLAKQGAEKKKTPPNREIKEREDRKHGVSHSTCADA
jgi:hypothetical protein